MFTTIINTIKSATKDIGMPDRSPKWPAAQKKHLKAHPTCASCGSAKNPQVHHKMPFHLHPELELDPTNFITLCMDNDCHLIVGHGNSFKAYNPNVVQDASYVNANLVKLKTVLTEVAAKAKANRLFE